MRSIRLFAGLLVLGCAVAAQQQEASSPKFIARTELVTVPVVVTRGGKFVSALHKDDFVIQEDGKAKPIAFFEEVVSQPVKLKTAETALGEYTNALTEPNQPVPLTVILLDRVFTPVPEYNNAIHELVTFVREHVKAGEPVMLAEVNDRGLKILQAFTTSPDALIAALTRAPRGLQSQPGEMQPALKNESSATAAAGNAAPAKANPAVAPKVPDSFTEYEGDSIGEEIDVTQKRSNPDPDAPKDKGPDQVLHDAAQRQESSKVEVTIRAMEQIARGLSGIPGRKALLWTSPGYMCPTKGFMKDARGKAVASSDQCEVIWRLLNMANISVYPIIPTQTENPTFSSGRCIGPCGGRHPVLQQLIIMSYAEYTGGKVCTYRNDLDTCYERAAEDSARYYMLSYYATASATPAWHRIHVTVNAPETNVRARNWYLSAGTAETIEAQYASDVSTAIISPVDYTGIPMTVRWKEIKEANGKKRAGFEIRIRPNALTVDSAEANHMKLHVVTVAMDASGAWTADMTQKIDAHLKESNLAELRATGLVYSNSIEIAPVTSRVKFVVRDALSGNMGTVTARVPRVR